MGKITRVTELLSKTIGDLVGSVRLVNQFGHIIYEGPITQIPENLKRLEYKTANILDRENLVAVKVIITDNR